jgi:hypothetical protein
MLTYGLPLYKMYRGGLAHKANHNYWGGASNLAEFDQFIWSDFFVQITKNGDFCCFIPTAQARLNDFQTPKMYSQVLDSEFIPLVKNQVVSLPLPHEEFDINYVYQY